MWGGGSRTSLTVCASETEHRQASLSPPRAAARPRGSGSAGPRLEDEWGSPPPQGDPARPPSPKATQVSLASPLWSRRQRDAGTKRQRFPKLACPPPQNKGAPRPFPPPARAATLGSGRPGGIVQHAGSAPALGVGGTHGNLPFQELRGPTSATGVTARPLGPRSLRPCPACTHLAASRATCGRALCLLAGPPSPSPGRAEADEGQAPRSSRAPPPARHRVPEKSGRWKVSVANGGRRALQRRRGGGAGGLSLPSVETGGAGLGAAAAGEGGTAGGTDTASDLRWERTRARLPWLGDVPRGSPASRPPQTPGGGTPRLYPPPQRPRRPLPQRLGGGPRVPTRQPLPPLRARTPGPPSPRPSPDPAPRGQGRDLHPCTVLHPKASPPPFHPAPRPRWRREAQALPSGPQPSP